MAKYKTSGLITEIRGSIGDKTFYYWKGVPVVRKKKGKHKQGNSLAQAKIRETFTFLSKTWASMGFGNRAVWEQYAKENRRIKEKSYNGLMSAIGNWYSGRIVFMSINQLLMKCGFPSFQMPLFGKSQPPLPSTDLSPISKWTKNIKFKIWLPQDYPDRCVVQVWIKKLSWPDGRSYIMTIVPISTSPTEIEIKKIRFRVYDKKKHKRVETIERNLNEIGYTKLLLQMRVIAENGRFSMPGAIYKLELRNHSLLKSPQTLKPLSPSTFHPTAKNRFRFPTNSKNPVDK